MSMPDKERLRSIKTFPSLVKYLRDELDWPIDSEDFEELTFDYAPEELGLDAQTAVKIKEVKQLRPLVSNQPWGIFFVNFEPKRLPVVVLRRILRSLVFKKRESSNKAQQAAWQLHDLLFISSYGEAEHRDITFAHFAEEPELGDLPTLRVLGWDDEDTALHLEHTDRELREKLRWPSKVNDLNSWRRDWSAAFTLKHREVIATSKELATRLADLATKIRKRANAVLRVESENGPFRKLYAAFHEALVHDLNEDDFADMYAQTISYGLLTARVSRPAALIAENLRDMVPVTNPFLKELLEAFLTAGGRKGKIDFDELGVSEVVQMLRDARMEDVLRDFGDRNPQEDPAIHFYELFLKEYDPEKRMKRGVFYTPRPVVSFIVRSVDEILRNDFGLVDGLADITTWSEMAKSHRGLEIPRGVSPNEPFAQVLDPAVGTGTFLVEVIDRIHKTMLSKWGKSGHMPLEFQNMWNEYVPKHLLPRLYGFELMMAPYAIAHMKIGLKLHETGYRFGSNERARIYLTNSLEKPHDLSSVFESMAPALAHESRAVNQVKTDQRFTVVLGNPPYSKISSNLTPEMRAIVERYRSVDGERIKERGALQFEINLQDDYVKFFRFCEEQVNASGAGIVGLITNNGYLSTPTLRGMRDSLLDTFSTIRVVDLHGHLARGETGPQGDAEENVFDILQGVAVFAGSRLQLKKGDATVYHADAYGSRSQKYAFLQSNSLASANLVEIEPSPPFYLFIPHDADLAEEWRRFIGLAEIFPKNSAGILTARDALVIDVNKKSLAERIERFSEAREKAAAVYEGFGFSESKRFDLREAQGELRKLKSFTEPIRRLLHRPFDRRFIFFHPSVVWSLSRPVANQMHKGDNLGLIATRQVTRPQFEHAFVSRDMIEIKACSHDRNTQIFPLFANQLDGALAMTSSIAPNLSETILQRLATRLKFVLNCKTTHAGQEQELTPLRFFYYAYSILYSPAYRVRYFEFLRSDFPRLPLVSNPDLFRALARLGGQLVHLHLMEAPDLPKPSTTFDCKGRAEVEKIAYDDETVWIDKDHTCGFPGVPKAVWAFHIGGYQVCEKWLKDRKHQTLSKADIEHFQGIVVALNETIRLMTQIDRVIETHGGWPDAFKPFEG